MYAESPKKMEVDSERFFEPLGKTVITSSICSWDPPFADEPVSDEQKRQTTENITADLERSGYRADLIGFHG